MQDFTLKRRFYTVSSMVKLVKLYISGIRSFGAGDADPQNIKFSSPLTVILGPNGSGKTTVIEALKFACTGELPEGSERGQGFIHDPKLSGSFKVKGQVRLKLQDHRGVEFSIFKTCQVVQNADDKLTFKRLDASLQIQKPDGQKRDVSGRCIDIDIQCRQIIGVSPAIINNVIFCHQENANWPLADGKKLKEKFDEIFDAVTYNKFIEHARKTIKDGKVELRIQEANVKASKEKKREAENLFNTLNDCKGRLNDIEKQIDEKKQALQPINTRIKEILKIEDELLEIRAELARKETEVANSRKNQEFILKNLDHKEFEGSDEDLQEEINSFSSNRKQCEQRKLVLEEKKSAIEDEERKISAENTKLQVKIGQLKQQKEHYKKLCADGNALLVKIKNDFSLTGEVNFSNVSSLKRALTEIEGSLESEKQSLDELSKKFEAEDAEMQSLIDEKNKKLTEIRQSVQMKQDFSRENEQKIRDINFELDDLCFADEQLNQLKTKIERIDADLAKLNAETDVNDLSHKVDEEKKNKRTLQDELNSLDNIYKKLQQNSEIDVELDLQRNETRKLESDINKLRSKNFDNFKNLFGDNVPESSLKKCVEKLLQIEQRKYDDFTSRISKKEKEIATLTAKLAAENEKLKHFTTELEKGKEQISTLCKEKTLQPMLSETEELLEKQQKEKGKLSAAKVIYEQFISEFEQDKPCCPVCQTDFTNKREATRKIIQFIAEKIRNIPNQLASVEENLKINQELYSKLLQLKPVNEKIRLLTTENIPTINREIESLDASLKRNKTDLEKLTKAVVQPKLHLDICRNVMPDAALIDQQKTALDAAKTKIVTLEGRLIKVPTDRSKQQVEMDMDKIKEDITTAEQNIESWQKKIDQFKTRNQQFRDDKNRLVQQQLDIQKAVQNKPKLEEQSKELQEKNVKLSKEIEELRSQESPLENELEEIKNRKETTKTRNQRTINEEQKALIAKRDGFKKLKELQNEVESHLRKNVDTSFDEALETLKENKTKLESLVEGKNKVLKTISELNTQLATQDTLFKSLENNLLLRKTRVEEKRAVDELQKIKEKTKKFDHIAIDREKEDLARERQELNNEIFKKSGEQSELLKRIKDDEKLLAKPENRDAHKNYKIDCYKYAVRDQALKDLERYVKNFENALMQFHTSCMRQINERVRQLWREIYRGGDIDHIQIKTEATTGTQLRRSFKYRVVQVKNGVELDMSGRCSAGQKVLASIIIRLALAERFSINCGILALDEPTTNLDKENIISLSSALVNIVNSRKMEENFQLIVITHDEEFLQELKHVDGMDHYWRVSRNDTGTSVIRKMHI